MCAYTGQLVTPCGGECTRLEQGVTGQSLLSSIALLWNRNEHIYLGSFVRVFFMTVTPMPRQCQSRTGSELRA